MLNILSFDVEEWCEFFNLGKRDQHWFEENRVRIATEKILRLLSGKNVKATFFFLGKVAERNPDLVKRIDAEGHEIASHGYSHKLISTLTPTEFRQDLSHSIAILKDILKKDIMGYRAPGYSITRETFWALEIIKECGLRYDSSIYPVSLRFFTKGGISGFPQKPFCFENNLVEFPMPTMNILGIKIPVATTSYFRVFPYGVTKHAIKALNARGIQTTLNFHSWEFDEEQPKVKLSFPQNIKHYYNLSKTVERFEMLIEDFKFTSCRDAISLIDR